MHSSPELYSNIVQNLQQHAIVASANSVLRRYTSTVILHAITSNKVCNRILFSNNLLYLDMRKESQSRFATQHVRRNSEMMKKLQLILSIWLRNGSACEGYSKFFQWNSISKEVYAKLTARELKVCLLMFIYVANSCSCCSC